MPRLPRLLLLLAACFVTLLAAHPAFAQGLPTPDAAPGAGEAIDRALGDLGGGDEVRIERQWAAGNHIVCQA